jgi:SAM-dependent methyltransferase
VSRKNTHLGSLSAFTWRMVELNARQTVHLDSKVMAEMSEAFLNYQTNNFCYFRPLGKEEYSLHEALTSTIDDCPEVVMSPTSKADNYRFSLQLDDPIFLEKFNRYIRFSQLDDKALMSVTQFLEFHKELLQAILGYSFNILNVRCQISEPGATVGPFEWHTDGLPDSIVKVLYYLDGTSEETGSTAVQLPSGEEVVFEGEAGSWVLININKIMHKGIPSIGRRRKMLEITLGPSAQTNCRAYAVALNGSYPWVPWLSPGFKSGYVNQPTQILDAQTKDFIHLLDELNSEAELDSSYHAAMSVLEYNAANPPKYLNIGGGPGFLHKEWKNLEEIFSVNNPVPFRLSPAIPFGIETGTLDTVYTSHNLEHLDDGTVVHVLSEGFRVLKRGGLLVIKIPDFDEYLNQWRKGSTSLTFENSPLSFKEAKTWRNKNIPDNITYRTAEIFSGVWDTKFGDEKALFSNFGDWNGPGYVGPPWIDEADIANIFTNTESCHEIAAHLKVRALGLGEKIYLNHQNAWSRIEMQKILTNLGFQIVSMDAKNIVENVPSIPGIEQMYSASAYYLAQKS